MRSTSFTRFTIVAAVASVAAGQQSIPLTIPAGVPLRLYLTRRAPKKVGEPVRAKLLEPVFAFDREVLPAGAEVSGRVTRLTPVPKAQRAASMLAGDFTPLHGAQVVFTDLLLPGGRRIQLATRETAGLASIYEQPRPQKRRKHRSDAQRKDAQNGGVLGTAKSEAQNRINGAISARTHGIADIVRSPNKREKLHDFLIAKLPYHPQWVRKGTRFDAELERPLSFGSAMPKADILKLIGTQPPADSIVHSRLLTALDSGSAQQGDKVEAVVSQPLFSPDHHLILPAGAHLIGKVTVAHRARWFHRGGQLRFNFQQIDLPDEVRQYIASQPPVEFKTVATLNAAEGSGKSTIKVDEEGGVKAVEPKTRLIRPAIALLVASRAIDNDTGHARAAGAADGNAGGRTLGGISGFGLLGAFAAHISPGMASALAMYGLGWSVYSTVVSRGGEVEFSKNAALDIRFGARPPAAAAKFARTF